MVLSSRFLRDLMWCLQVPPLLARDFDALKYSEGHHLDSLQLQTKGSTPAQCNVNLKKHGFLQDIQNILSDLRFSSSQEWQTYAQAALSTQFISRSSSCKKIQRTDNIPKYKPLGIYFEELISCWLEHSQHFSVIADHHPIIDSSTLKTCGEIDWILLHNQTKQLAHWECAIKFYLANPVSSHLYDFKGPGLIDTLGYKIDHMLGHQLHQSLHPSLQRSLQSSLKNVDLDKFGAEETLRDPEFTSQIERVCLIKGVLFFQWNESEILPKLNDALYWSHSDQLNLPLNVKRFLSQDFWFSYWLETSQVLDFCKNVLLTQGNEKTDEKDLGFVCLNKLDWFAPLSRQDFRRPESTPLRTLSELIDHIENGVPKIKSSSHHFPPQLVAATYLLKLEPRTEHLPPEHETESVEIVRFFVVPRKWKQQFLEST